VEGDTVQLQQDHGASNSPQRFTAMIDDFQTSIAAGRDAAIPGHNGLQMVKIANALLESSRHGRAVRIS
jgi:predicted dehydrogenase